MPFLPSRPGVVGRSRALVTTTFAVAALLVGAFACGDRPGSAQAGKTPATTAGSADTPAATPVAAFGSDTLVDSVLIARADRGRITGSDSAAMWIIMISDYQCPFCKQWHDSTSAGVMRDYVNTGKVRMAHIHLPLPQHQHARKQAEASLCAGAQGKFWEYSAALFHEQERVARMTSVDGLLDSLARANSLEPRAFAHCRQSNAIRTIIASDIQQATRAGVRSTPSFLVGEFLVEGASPYPNFRRAIDTALVLARKKGKAR